MLSIKAEYRLSKTAKEYYQNFLHNYSPSPIIKIVTDSNTKIHLVITIAGLREWHQDLKLPTYHFQKKQYSGPRSPAGVLLFITGLGLENSRQAAEYIKNTIQPFYILNIGSCGGISETAAIGTWHQIEHCKNETQPAAIRLTDTQPFLWPQSINFQASICLSLAKAAESKPSTKADIVDMEAYAQAQVFENTQLSFHALKYVSDRANENTASDYQTQLTNYKKDLLKLFSFLSAPTDLAVIIPTHNRLNFLKQAVDSVLNQDILPDELIIIDDASSDGTAQFLAHCEGIEECQFKSLFHREQLGVSAARNSGLELTQCHWVAFLDSDDQWLPEKISKQIDYLENYPFYGILQSNEKWIRDGKPLKQESYHQKPLGWAFEQSLERCLISPSSVMIQSNLFEAFGNFDEKLKACEDYDLWLRISRYLPIGLGEEVSLIKIGGHSDQLSQTPLMDWYRVLSLQKLIKKERNPYLREKIGAVLNKKFSILKKGALKHNNKSLLEKLNTIDIDLNA